MGAHFSKDPEIVQLLVKNPAGRLSIYKTDDIGELQDCVPLPVGLEPNVKYAFITTKEHGMHPHMYKDSICDVPGNDIIAESDINKTNKLTSTMGYSANSNSRYFNFSEDLANKPDYPIFFNKNGNQEFAAKSSFQKCIPMPFHSTKVGRTAENITYNRNGVPMIVYTDNDCKNEYITEIPIDPKIQDNDRRQYNIDNRATKSETNTLPFTNVRTIEYMDPAINTNARYYRSFRTDYPRSHEVSNSTAPPKNLRTFTPTATPTPTPSATPIVPYNT